MWKMSFPPFQPADHVLRRQGKATGMIPSQIASTPVCFPNIRPVNGSKLSPRWCHRCWRPPTWSLGPSGPSGVLPSPADQAHRRAQGSEAAKFSCFPHPTVALPYPAYVPARRPPPFPPPQQTLWTCSRDSAPPILFLINVKTTCRKPFNILFFGHFWVHLLPLLREK